MIKKIDLIFKRYFHEIIGTSKDGIDDIIRTENALYKLFSYAFVSLILIFFINIAFALVLGMNEMDKIGAWGDFLGGTLNPILTFITFTGLLITIVLQKTELREAREEFKRSANALELQHTAINKQSFEATFFQMLTLHNTIVESLQVVVVDGENETEEVFRGRECFNLFYTELSDIYKIKLSKKGAPYTGNPKETIRSAYKVFWNTRNRILAHYFRYLYNVVRFVKESPFCDDTYLRLIRSQLSDQELLMLFYNCMTEQGDNFRKLTEEFSLLDNLNPMHLLDRSHENLIAKEAFVKNTKAE